MHCLRGVLKFSERIQTVVFTTNDFFVVAGLMLEYRL